MGPEVVNKNKDCEFSGPYAGRDLYITMLQDSEREFVVTHNANIKPVAYFTGRETELQELRQRIEAGRKSVLVSGMGGIGKTHICRKLFEEYLNRHSKDENGPFRHLGYIEYSGDMGSSLQNCLKFKQQNSPEQNQEAAWRELEYLASDGKLLLFVDNVDKPMRADSGLQRLKGIPGAIVLTSRQVSFSNEFEPYRIGFLDMGQCIEIYEKIRFGVSGRKIDPGEVEDLEYIIENLAGRHTITVELLAHLARIKLLEAKRLREELDQNGFRLEFHRDGELVNIQESYEKLYDLSELTEAEQNILEAFSVFPYIPLAAETCNEWLLSDAGASKDDDILMGLYQKGWLQFYVEKEAYALHPVFAQFIYGKYRPKAESHLGLLQACRNCLKISSVLEWQRVIPFAENIVEKVNMGKGLEQAGFTDTLAYLFIIICEYEKAERLYEGLLEKSISEFGENHRKTAEIYNNLGILYASWWKQEKMEVMWKKCFRILKSILGDKHIDIAVFCSDWAFAYSTIGRHEKAEEMYKECLKIQENVLGKNHEETVRSYHNLCETGKV